MSIAPSQQVLDSDRADAVDGDRLVQQLIDGRQRADGHAGRLAQGDQLSEVATTDARHRDDHLRDLPLGHDPREVLRAADDLDAVDATTALASVVIEEGDGFQAKGAIPSHFADQHGAGLAGAVDQNRPRRASARGSRAFLEALLSNPRGEPDAAQHDE